MEIRAGLNVALSCVSEDPFLTSELFECFGFLDLEEHNCPCLNCEKLWEYKYVSEKDDCAVFRKVITPRLTVFLSCQSDLMP